MKLNSIIDGAIIQAIYRGVAGRGAGRSDRSAASADCVPACRA